MTIEYQNINEEKVTPEQLNSLSEYYKVFYEDQLIIKKEFFINNVLVHICHYKSGTQSESDIKSMYNSQDIFYSINEKINLNNHVIEIVKEYSGNTLRSHFRFLYDLSNNVIGEENIDLFTGLPEFAKTEKYYYDFEKDDCFPILTASYYDDGSLDIIQYDSYRFDGQDEVIFAEDGISGINDLETLKKIIGFSSDQMNYYLTARLEPIYK